MKSCKFCGKAKHLGTCEVIKNVEKQNIVNLIDNIAAFSEALGGLRNSLIAQGFSQEVAEAIVFNALQHNIIKN